jgi:hypothetical protein
VCETFTDLNDPAREEPVHNIFMEKFPDDTNQGTPSQGDSCAFPFFGNVGVPFMATLYILGLNVGLLVWLGTTPNVTNSLDASQLRTLCHGHHVDVPLSTKSSPPPSAFSSESLATSNRKSKQNRKRKNKKNKSPTSVSHVGDRSSTFESHVEDQHPASASHDGGKIPVTASHTGDRSVASVSHVIDQSLTFASHVGDVQPTTTSHARGTSLINASHTSDMSTTSVIHVEDKKPTTASHARGIDSVEKPRWIGHKPKFPCNLCKGYHLTHLFLGLLEAGILWPLSASSSDFESSTFSS